MTAPSSGERLHWADTAKAIAVVLVVVYHVALTGMTNLAPGAVYAKHPWGIASTWLLPVRMPLFFLVSGVLAVRALRRPWGRVLRARVADNYWTFVLWTAAIAVFYAWAYAPQVFTDFLVRALSWVVTLGGFYWYLPMLALFFVTAKVLRSAPWLALALGAGLYLLAPDLPRSVGGDVANDAMLALIRYCQFLVWFMVGAHLRAIVERIAGLPMPVGLVLGAAYVPLARAQYVDGHKLDVVLSLIGISAVLVLSNWISRHDGIRRLGRYLAERTLPIYLVHPFLLTLVALVLPALPAIRARFTIILVPLLVAALVFVAVRCYDLTRDRIGWLYRSPRRAERAESTSAESG